jgi:signal transduction histidine kinase
VANVRRHAQALRVDVFIEEQGGGYLVRIIDDGRGTAEDPQQRSRPGHLGVRAMRERAEATGGWFRFESAPRRGTTVEFFVPSQGPAAGAVGT